MQAIVLAGGLGTRLRPLTFSIPKPLIPVGKHPILEILIKNLASHGTREIYLAVGYRAELIELYFQDGAHFGVDIHYSREEKRLGTAGPVRLARDQFGLSGTILVINSDIITNVNFEDFLNWHSEKKASITIGVRNFEHTVPFGVVDMEGDNITSIVEKPVHSSRINCGIYALDSKILDLVPSNEEFYMPDLIQAVVNQGGAVCGYEVKEKWVSIDNIGDLEEESSQMERDAP